MHALRRAHRPARGVDAARAAKPPPRLRFQQTFPTMPPRFDSICLLRIRHALRPREPVARSLERAARQPFTAHPTVAAGVLLEFCADHVA
eukprot:8822370-Pyramimonas_sp.AAC.1